MSLGLTLNNALTGLKANQTQLSVLSQNISNANTVGYSRQVAHQQAVYLANEGAGVKIESITRNVDKYLQRTIQLQKSQSGYDGTISEYMERTQILLGEPTQDYSLNAQIDNFFSALQDLADNPQQTSIRESTMIAAENLTRSISDLAYEIEDLRFEADLEISRTVKKINELSKQLYEVNIAIGNAKDFSQGNAGLLDRRDAILEELSEYLDLKINIQSDEKAHVYLAGGASLVDYDLHQLQYNVITSVNSFIDDSSIGPIVSVAIDYKSGRELSAPRQVVGPGSEGSVDTFLRSGKLRALLEYRDVIAPDYLSTLDELAANLRDEVNAVHNQGAGFPPPSQLTGQTLVAPEDTRGWLGQANIAVLNADGTPLDNPFNTVSGSVERGGFRPMTLNFGFDSGEGEAGIHSMDTIADEINAYFGPQGAQVHLNNLNDIKLVVENDNIPAGTDFTFDFDVSNITDDMADVQILGVALTGPGVVGATPAGTYSLPPGLRTRTGQDFSFDLTGVVGPVTIDVTVQVTNPVTGLVETSTISYNFNPAVTDIKNRRYDATAATATGVVEAPLNANAVARAYFVGEDGNQVPQGSAGYLRIETLDPDHRLVIDEGGSSDNGRLYDTPPVLGTGKGFSHFFGLNNFFDENKGELGPDDPTRKSGSAVNMSVRDDILLHSNYISVGTLQRSQQSPDPAFSPTYTYELAIGSRAIGQKLADIGGSNVAFDESGLLATTSMSLSAFATAFIGAGSAQAADATNVSQQTASILDAYQSRADSIKGVNLDEELGNTIIFQNAYSASARVITVTGEMFDALLNSV